MNNIRTYGDISEFLKSSFFEQSAFIACRTNFYENYVQDSDLSTRLDLDLTVCKWTKGKLNGYIDKIFSTEEVAIREYVKTWMDRNFGDWIQTPLMTSIVCFLLKEQPLKGRVKETLGKIINERTLLIEYTKRFIEREVGRRGLELCKEEIMRDTIAVLKETGWMFYQQEQIFNYQMRGKIEDLEPAYEIANAYLGVVCFAKHYSYNTHIYFLDFTVSEYIVERMMKNDNMEFLDFMLSANINKLIFQALNECEDDVKKQISANLRMEYMDRLLSDSSNIIRRTHIVYYLSRIDLEENKKILKNILHDMEKEVEIKLSICFGMIKLGDLEEEEYLFHMLEEDPEWDDTNRGYHLLYYKDVEGMKVPFRDDGKGTWKKTFNALKNHICQEEQYYYLTRIDLQIMKRFFICHEQKDMFTKADIEDIEQSILKRKKKKSDFVDKVAAEWEVLKSVIENVNI